MEESFTEEIILSLGDVLSVIILFGCMIFYRGEYFTFLKINVIGSSWHSRRVTVFIDLLSNK